MRKASMLSVSSCLFGNLLIVARGVLGLQAARQVLPRVHVDPDLDRLRLRHQTPSVRGGCEYSSGSGLVAGPVRERGALN